MKINLRPFHLIVATLLIASSTWAQSFVGTVVAVKGDVKVLHARSAGDQGPFAKLRGQEYAYREVKLGDRLNPGELILSGPNGQIRIVYSNGDTFFVRPSSSFVLPVHKTAAKYHDGTSSAVKMFYGKFRALISKNGPRNRLNVVTKDAVSGVRGTDFFVQSYAATGTELTVLRGAVAFQPKNHPADVTVVHSAQSATAHAQTKLAPSASATTHEVLAQIQEDSNLKADPQAVSALPTVKQQQIDALQKKAFESEMADIQSENPALYQTLIHHATKNVDQVNSEVLAQLSRSAPTAPQHKKPAVHYRHPVVH